MRILAAVLAVLGVLAVGYWTVATVRRYLYQAKGAHQFTETPRAAEDLAAKTRGDSHVEAEPYPDAGSAIATLIIPRVGLSTVVVEGDGPPELKLAAGHIPGTPLSGYAGNVGVAGHRDTVFRPLRLIRKDDEIRLIHNGHEYRYTVVSTKIVAPDEVEVLTDTGRETLTLVTCYPFHFVGPAPNRFIVRADCIGCPARKHE